MNQLKQDLRFALRYFRRTPITTITMILVLAIGIGVNSALFVVLSSIVARPVPGISHDKSLVRLRTLQRFRQADLSLSVRAASYPEFQDYAARTDVFAATVASVPTTAVIDQAGATRVPTAVAIEFVTPTYFQTLGIQLVAGPGLPMTEAGASSPDPVAVISNSLWLARFGGTNDVVGRKLRLNGVSVTVVGVAAPEYGGINSQTIVWAPLALRSILVHRSSNALASRDSSLLTLFARLQPGVGIERASTVAQTIGQRSTAQISARQRPFLGTADVVPILTTNASPERGDGWYAAVTVATITLLVLIITCLNVSALLVGASIHRAGEIAVRLSLGASRARIVRQLLTENVVVAACGGGLGLVFLKVLTSVITVQINSTDLHVGLGATAFTLAFAIGTSLLFGLSPALHATRASVADAMKGSGTHATTPRSRLQRGFVIAQVALTQPLLVALALPFGNLVQHIDAAADPGVRDRVIAIRGAWDNGHAFDSTLTDALALEQRLRGLPGVVSVVRTSNGYGLDWVAVHPADRSGGSVGDTRLLARLEKVGPGYFNLMGIPLLRGRDFTPRELGDFGDLSVIIGSDLARTLWGTADPIGRRLQSWGRSEEWFGGDPDMMSDSRPSPPHDNTKPSTLTVVGVVDAAKTGKSNDLRQIRLFTQSASTGSLLVRTQSGGIAAIPMIRQIMTREFPALPAYEVETLSKHDADRRHELMQESEFASGAGLLILLLASVGLYGVVGCAVAQRTREIGVRVALGATPSNVVTMFVRRGAVLGVIGMSIGLLLSVATIRVLMAIDEFPQIDSVPVSAGIAFIVVTVSLLATWLPARRAAGVDPLVALRAE
jgi:predicted permease